MNNGISEKEKKVVDYFLEHPDAYISEVVKETGISKSSVQRYLQKYGDTYIHSLNKTIKDQLKENKTRGQRLGGIHSFQNNDFVKDDAGHFIGNVVSTATYDKESKKREDIVRIVTYYLNNKTITLNDLANVFSELYGYSRDYVYDCLLDTRVSEILGDEKAKEVEENLSNNRNTFLRKISDLGLTLENINQDFGLTELERKVFDERFFSPDTSLTSMEEKFQMSKSALLKHENKAIAKIEKGLGRNK